ncbi:PQQ-binding-like beta-propeller repeat protein [Haladaptatus sp. DFWS20]|uniref:outer membrane protein assembly factor BamB family protein n=1 Tax=Haladaptatus sp. DFWS20 TaxID=3403467 RepID=UPI003EBFAA28
MDRRTFLQTVGIGATATLAGNQFTRGAGATVVNSATNWTRPWGTTGQTRFNRFHESTHPYGQLDWERRDSGYWSGTPTVSDNILYVGELTDDVSFTGAISAYDAESGNRLWSARDHPVTESEKERIAQSSESLLEESTAPYGFLTHAPVVDNGVVYAIGRSSGDEHYYVAQGVYALDTKTGEELWARTDLTDYSALEIANGLVYLSGIALDAQTGDTVWETAADEKMIGVVDDTFYTYATLERPSDDVVILIARNAKSGGEKWRTLSPFGTEGRPKAVDEDFIYIVSPEAPDEDGIESQVCALSTTDGQVQWKTTLTVRDGTVDVSAPAVDTTSVYLFTRGTTESLMSPNIEAPIDGIGTALAIDRETGAEQWRFETPAAFVGDPAVDASSVYGAARYHTCSESPTQWVKAGLYSLDKQTGVERWNYAMENLYTISSPAVAADRIFLATHGVGGTMADATMYSFRGCECPPDCHSQFADDGKTQTVPQPPEQPQTTTSSPETTQKDHQTTTPSPKTTDSEQTTTTTPANSLTTTDRSSTVRSTTTDQRSQTSTSKISSISTNTAAQTTTSDGQAGFGVLGAIGGLIGGGLYALRRSTGRDEN